MDYEVEIDKEVFLPKYRRLIGSDADIIILWGGRDSGKTWFAGQKLITECLTLSYFKCILSRKVQDTIRDSQYEVLKSIIHEWGLDDLFTFKLSPLEIICKNGNKFIAKGADAKGKVKGANNPTHLWGEEWSQVSKAEYLVVSTTLRSNETKVQEIWTFNPEAEGVSDYKNFWIYDYVGENYKDQTVYREMEVDGEKTQLKIEVVHSTYGDNKFCTPERKAKYLSAVQGDEYFYNVWIRGYWGNKEVKSPFLKAYNTGAHESESKMNHNAETLVLIDFNVNPFCCSIFNAWYDHDGPHVHQVGEIAVDDGTTSAMATEIKEFVGQSLQSARIGGDAMGANSRLGRYDNKSLFSELAAELNLSRSSFKLVANPTHKKSANDCNYFLRHFPDFKVGKHCTSSITDYKTVEVDAYGQIIKKNRKKDEQRADFLDNFRYLVNTFFSKQIEQHRRTGQW